MYFKALNRRIGAKDPAKSEASGSAADAAVVIERIETEFAGHAVPDLFRMAFRDLPDRPAADGRGRSYLRSVFQNVLDLFRIADADGREDRNLDGLADRRRIRHQQAAALRQTVRRRGHQVGRGQSSR